MKAANQNTSQDISRLIDSYYSWLKDKTKWKNLNEWAEITSPYLDRNNDYIQIYLKKTNEGCFLTDDGATINGLIQEGCKLDSPKRKQLLQLTLKGYGVTEKNGALQIIAVSKDAFPLCKHSLAQAILAVNDMFYTAAPHISSLFFEDVKDWLESSNIRYSERVCFNGASGYNRSFDFLIPKSDKQPERLIKTLNDPQKNRADCLIMDWEDTKSVRLPTAKMYVFINDGGKSGGRQAASEKQKSLGFDSAKTKPQGSLNGEGGGDPRSAAEKAGAALRAYSIEPVLWSQRAKKKRELAA